MKTLRVIDKVLKLNAGTLALSEAQAKVRRHALRHIEGNRYEIAGPVEFKVGEEIGFDGDLPKHLATALPFAAQIMEPAPAAPAAPARRWNKSKGAA